MPTYEYVCKKCGNEFDFFQSMKDKPLKKCIDEACKGPVKRKIGTGAGIIFKGSGFYETDYRSESYKKAAASDSKASSSSEGGSSKSDSKSSSSSTPKKSEGGGSKKKETSPSSSN